MNDIDLMPTDLKEKSLSDREIVLTFPDALKAIDILKTNKWDILGWEVWISHPNGKHGHPLPYVIAYDTPKRCNEEWDSYVERTANYCKETMIKESTHWDCEIYREFPGCVLYFCITATERVSG